MPTTTQEGGAGEGLMTSGRLAEIQEMRDKARTELLPSLSGVLTGPELFALESQLAFGDALQSEVRRLRSELASTTLEREEARQALISVNSRLNDAKYTLQQCHTDLGAGWYQAKHATQPFAVLQPVVGGLLKLLGRAVLGMPNTPAIAPAPPPTEPQKP